MRNIVVVVRYCRCRRLYGIIDMIKAKTNVTLIIWRNRTESMPIKHVLYVWIDRVWYGVQKVLQINHSICTWNFYFLTPDGVRKVFNHFWCLLISTLCGASACASGVDSTVLFETRFLSVFFINVFHYLSASTLTTKLVLC